MPENDPQLTTTPFDRTSIESKYHCLINVERAEEVLGSAIQACLDNGEFYERKKQAEEDYVKFLSKMETNEDESKNDEFIANALFLLSLATFGSSSEVFFNGLAKDRRTYLGQRALMIPSEVIKYKLLSEVDVKAFLEWKAQINKPVPIPGLLNEEVPPIPPPPISEAEYNDSFNKRWREFIHVKGRQGEALEGWYHNCQRLCEKYGGSVFGLFKANDNDAVKILHALIDEPNGKPASKEFKRFRRKLASLFIQWVGTYNLYPLEKLNEFGLPVDFQLCRISIQTGIVSVLPGPEIRREDFANSIFLPTIAYLCKKNNWEPRLVSESLWLIGSQGCSKDQRRKSPYFSCPIKDSCNGILHKMENDFLGFTEEKIEEKLRLWGDYEKPHF